MKPYGYKKHRKPPGDGCHLCMKGLSCSSKRTKKANRAKAKQEIEEQITPLDQELTDALTKYGNETLKKYIEELDKEDV